MKRDMREAKKKEAKVKKKKVKSVYLIGIGAIFIVACLFAFMYGYLPTRDNVPADEETMMQFGLLDSSQTSEEEEKHVLAFIEQNAGISEACEIMHFYSYNCGACQRLEPWLIAFKAQYPEIQITSYELHENESRQLLENAKRRYGMTEASVPIVFICGSVLEGIGVIQKNLERMALAVYDIAPRENTQVPVPIVLPLELSTSSSS